MEKKKGGVGGFGKEHLQVTYIYEVKGNLTYSNEWMVLQMNKRNRF